jgi:hypothetical protein
MNKWEPWMDHQADSSLLDIPEITEPPCKNCVHWRPQRVFKSSKQSTAGKGQRFEGVRMCHAEDMHEDFSCFKAKEQPEVKVDWEAFQKP